MKWLTLLSTFLLVACHDITQEVLEPTKVMVAPIHQLPTVFFLEDSPIDVTNTIIRINYGQ